MSALVKTKPRIYLVTVVHDSGVMHMWTSLLDANNSLNAALVQYNLHDEALLRFRCFAGKHLVGTSVKAAQLREVAEADSFPGRFRRNKKITDVLNYLSKDADGRVSENGKLFVWGKPFKRTFRLLEGPVDTSRKTAPELFPGSYEVYFLE